MPGRVPNRPGGASAGFTLIELVAALAILALMAGLAAPVISRGLDGPALRGAARTLAADLRQARARAMETGRVTRVRFDAARGTWHTPWRDGRAPKGVALRIETPPIGISGLDGQSNYKSIYFTPSGGATGGRVVLTGPAGRVRGVSVDFLTGRVFGDEG